eukprot:TRINITY_DN15329_c0_g1_i1.p1 TRINITY_DN15329_c0_g1~~TRINITY_DN15329_c0_g1_i1.p1  ORF type:complete len:181 (+),score=38.72 TRINITY_DN15329_c0_g1_i1:27-545(+)
MSSSVIRYQFQGSLHSQKELNCSIGQNFTAEDIEKQILETTFFGNCKQGKVCLEFVEKSTQKVYKRNDIIPVGANLIVKRIPSWKYDIIYNEEEETNELSAQIDKDGNLEEDDTPLEQVSRASHAIKYGGNFSANITANVQQYIRLLNIKANSKDSSRSSLKNPEMKREPNT